MNRSSVSDRISSIAKIVASDKLIQKKLQTGDPTHVIQGITNEIMVASNLDFIVIMDLKAVPIFSLQTQVTSVFLSQVMKM